jgi:glycosyltransferase involved in cell wall biosynthesis
MQDGISDLEHHVPFAIVIPSYGEPRYLKFTLESVIRTQSLDTRVIVVDDFSPTDFIRNLCLQFSQRIIYLRNEKNLGISGNFNHCIAIANAQWVMLMGPDDLLISSITDELDLRDLNSKGVTNVHSKVKAISSSNAKGNDVSDLVKRIISPKKDGLISKKRLCLSLLIGNWTYNPAILWNTELLPERPFSEELRMCMDWNLLIQLALSDHYSYFTTSEYFLYRRHSSSVSMSNHFGRRAEEKLVMSMTSHSLSTKQKFLKILCKIQLMSRLNYFWRLMEFKRQSVT